MSSVVRQFLATFSCNLLSFSTGSAATWGAPNFATLTSEKAPFESGALTKEQASLVISLASFGSLIGTLIFTAIVDRFSRKILLNSIAVPYLVSWTIILYAPNVYYLYVARMIIGVAGSGVFVVIPLYVSEIADDKYRGRLGSVLILGANLGCLFGYAISMFLDYSGQIVINLAIPVLFVLSFSFFPESPKYLIKQNQNAYVAAEKSLKFFRDDQSNAKTEEETELNEIGKSEKVQEMNENESSGLSFSDFTSRAAKKATIISLFLCAVNQLSGAVTMTSYTNNIFRDSGSSLSEDTSSVIIGSVQLLANVMAMLLVDHTGRKFLLTISFLGATVGLSAMGFYDIFKAQLSDYNWIPIVAFSEAIFMLSIGILPLTMVILSEILPEKIKSIVTLLSLEVMFVLQFVLISLFPTVSEMFGVYTFEFLFAICCIIGLIFCLKVLPETKAKTYDEIMKALEK